MAVFKEQSNYLVVGKKGSGKSCFGWKTAETIHRLQGKKVYTFQFPRPELLKRLPFKVTNITKHPKLHNLTNAVIIFDEAHKHFHVLAKKVNEQLKNLLSNSRQNDIDCIFICHNSYFINRSLFTFIDVRVIKEVVDTHWELERSHMKKLYENNPVYGPENYYIDTGEITGKYSFEKPIWFTKKFSHAYKTRDNPIDLFKVAMKSAPKVRSVPVKCTTLRPTALKSKKVKKVRGHV